jgi:hypothetical protein
LIEAILAIGIMAMVLFVINGAFFTALHLREQVTAAVDDALPAQQVTAILRRDLVCAMAPGGVLAGDFKVGNVSEMNMSQPVDIEMYTPTGSLRESDPWADIQMVTYELKPSGNRSAPGSDLYRSVTRNLLSTTTPDVQDQSLLSGVQDLHFSCYDGTQWLDQWDTTNGNTNLPVAVRVRIQMAGANANGPIELIVPLVSQVRTNQLQPIAN